MPRYALSLAFHGKDFHGWQIQKNSITIQAILENALKLILKENVRLVGCGRTDTGVHARFFVAHTDLHTTLSQTDRQNLIHTLNKILPHSIKIYEIIDATENFHARYSAKDRTYKYIISLTKNPFLWDFTLYFPHKLDVALMNLSCLQLYNNSNFKALCKSGGDNKSYECKIYNANWELKQSKSLLIFTITANRFLRTMIRTLVGTMILIGQEKLSIEKFNSIIQSKDRTLSGKTVDAKGLVLWDVNYENVVFDKKNLQFAIS